MKFHSARNLLYQSSPLLAIAAALAILPACATQTWSKGAGSPLPIETIPARSDSVVNFRTHETSARLYVAGSARRGAWAGRHIDVQLIGRDGRVLAEKRDRLDSPAHSRTPRGRTDVETYVVSFPLSEARQAEKVRVIAHGGAHSGAAS